MTNALRIMDRDYAPLTDTQFMIVSEYVRECRRTGHVVGDDTILAKLIAEGVPLVHVETPPSKSEDDYLRSTVRSMFFYPGLLRKMVDMSAQDFDLNGKNAETFRRMWGSHDFFTSEHGVTYAVWYRRHKNVGLYILCSSSGTAWKIERRYPIKNDFLLWPELETEIILQFLHKTVKQAENLHARSQTVEP